MNAIRAIYYLIDKQFHIHMTKFSTNIEDILVLSKSHNDFFRQKVYLF